MSGKELTALKASRESPASTMSGYPMLLVGLLAIGMTV